MSFLGFPIEMTWSHCDWRQSGARRGPIIECSPSQTKAVQNQLARYCYSRLPPCNHRHHSPSAHYSFTIEGKTHVWKLLSSSSALSGPEQVGASAFQRSPHWRQPIRMLSLCLVHRELEEAPGRTCQYLLF